MTKYFPPIVMIIQLFFILYLWQQNTILVDTSVKSTLLIEDLKDKDKHEIDCGSVTGQNHGVADSKSLLALDSEVITDTVTQKTNEKTSSLVDGDSSLEVDESSLNVEESDFSNINNDSFSLEETDLNWALKQEENIKKLFLDSESLDGMGFENVECRATACKITVTRSRSGAFIDSHRFSSELEKQKWASNNGFSFVFGQKGAEEYVVFWVKR